MTENIENKKIVSSDAQAAPAPELSDDAKIDLAAKRILKEHKAAFIELAK